MKLIILKEKCGMLSILFPYLESWARSSNNSSKSKYQYVKILNSICSYFRSFIWETSEEDSTDSVLSQAGTHSHRPVTRNTGQVGDSRRSAGI